MKRQVLFAVTLSLLTCLVCNAQTPQFEVATVKPSALVDGVRGGCHGIDSSPRAAGSITLEFEGQDGLISAVQSQLGLKIETVKSTSEILVVDGAQKPVLQH